GPDAVGGRRRRGVPRADAVAGGAGPAVSNWTWFVEYEKDARTRGDAERLRLAGLRREAWTFRETDPARAYALYREGRRLARGLREPWWEMFYSYRQLAALLFFKRDYKDAIRRAVENVLEVRKPAYANFPFRFAVFYGLVVAYMGVDVEGYA